MILNIWKSFKKHTSTLAQITWVQKQQSMANQVLPTTHLNLLGSYFQGNILFAHGHRQQNKDSNLSFYDQKAHDLSNNAVSIFRC